MNMKYFAASSSLGETPSLTFVTYFVIRRSGHQMCSVKTVFLEISQNSQENTCARDSFLIKLQA